MADPKSQPESMSVFICGGRRRVDCSTPGCTSRATKQCDHVVIGRVTGTCDRPLCGNCAWEQKPGVDLCQPHAKRYR